MIEAKKRTTYVLYIISIFSLPLMLSLNAQSKQSERTISYEASIPESSITDVWDPNKYIDIDEIKPGMQAYCLTCYKGTEIEKFDLEVLSILHNVMPGRDLILVQGTDERFIYTGPVGGCSGSPVYINGRLAGALAHAPGWPFSKDPLYGVTLIKDILKTGQDTNLTGFKQSPQSGSQPEGLDRNKPAYGRAGFELDFTNQIDFFEIIKQFSNKSESIKRTLNRQTTLPCPLIASALPDEVCEQLNTWVEPFGLTVVPGTGGKTKELNDDNVKLDPGACLVVPLVTGDIEMEVIGTVTEVTGDKVYGFGHGLLSYGTVDLPIATGKVHTVVSNLARSFKIVSSLEIVGALTKDESTAVYGRIGAEAKMIPMTIRINRYNDTQRIYNCQVANNRLLTPVLIRTAVMGAALYLGDFPPDHTIEYKVNIDIEDQEPINFENVSTGSTLNEIIAESIGSILLLMNNPFKEVKINALDFDIRIVPRNITAHIWSVELSDSKVKAGQEVDVTIVVESQLSKKKQYQFSFKIPDELAPGKYSLIACGSVEYERFLRKTVPHKFAAINLSSLLEAMNYLLHIERDKLYCILILPPGGIIVERAELPDLPATKALVLQNTKRALKALPYQHWLEKSLETETVIIDGEIVNITVEK